MTLGQQIVLQCLLRPDLSGFELLRNKERADAKDQHLRHWLLDIHGGSTQKDPALRDSRFNVANVDVTLGFLRGLIKFCFLPLDAIRIITHSVNDMSAASRH